MTPAFATEAMDGDARTGSLTTAHGPVRTPAFMPVGTHATVKALHPDEMSPREALEALYALKARLPKP